MQMENNKANEPATQNEKLRVFPHTMDPYIKRAMHLKLINRFCAI